MMNNGTSTTRPLRRAVSLSTPASATATTTVGFITLTTQNFHGLLMHNNFTYSKALGTGAFVQATSEYTPNDAFDLSKMYGVQAFNRKFVYNSYMVYQPTFYKGQQGILGRVAGGWSFAPIFTAGSGEPLYCDTQTDGQSFGSADANNYFYKRAVRLHQQVQRRPFLALQRRGHRMVWERHTAGSGNRAVNMFADPEAIWNQVRAPILGIDSKNPGVGPIDRNTLLERRHERGEERQGLGERRTQVLRDLYQRLQPQHPRRSGNEPLRLIHLGRAECPGQHSTQDGVRHARQLLNFALKT